MAVMIWYRICTNLGVSEGAQRAAVDVSHSLDFDSVLRHGSELTCYY